MVRIVATGLIALAALWLTFSGTEPALIVRTLSDARAWPTLAAFICVVLTVAASAQRWRLLVFPPPVLGGSYPRFAAAVLTAQMLNALLPIRLGELGRAYWISRSDLQPLGRVLATIVAERLTDVVMLGASLAILLIQVALPPWAEGSVRLALSAAALAVGTAVILSIRGRQLVRALERPLRWLPARAARFLLRHGDTAITEIAALGRWQTSAGVWALSALIVVLAAATNYALFIAFDLPLSPVVALLLFVVLQIGGAPVATPGNLGVFHLLTVLVLTTFGIDRPLAIAYAVVLHIVAVGSKILAGGIILVTMKTPMLEHRSG